MLLKQTGWLHAFSCLALLGHKSNSIKAGLVMWLCAVLQLGTVHQSVERLQQQVTTGQAELQLLRSHVEQLTKDLQAAKVQHTLL